MIANIAISLLIGWFSQADFVNALIFIIGCITFSVIDLEEIRRKNLIEIGILIVFGVALFIIFKPKNLVPSLTKYSYIPVGLAMHIRYVLIHSENW